MKNFFIRRAEERDLTAICEIEKVSFPDYWSEEAFRANLDDGSIFNVICDGYVIIGYEILSLIPPESELYNIAVLPEYRGTGAADLLYSETEKAAAENGVDTVFLEVRESNLRARRFYEKTGFKAVGKRKKYYRYPTEDAVLMMKNI